MSAIFTPENMLFILAGLKTTLYISVISILLSTLFGTILGVLRSLTRGVPRAIAAVYIEVVRNIPNLLWIYVIFIVFRLKSMDAGVVSFTIFTSAAVGEIVRGGLNSVGKGQWEAARSQGFNLLQVLWYVVLPQAMRNMIPALVSQFVTVIKDTSFLWSVIAIQEITGKVTILMGRYYKVNQVFILYGILALTYFVINFAISHFSRRLQKRLSY
ncbi:amino acid ABC transporter permease [Papillibacter cinnamivorans]|uniref:Putative glutamine transport system permease protein n=1 Tax=Papillibacter cinnamivorans DSM 12816 TaxID=1122930 RepID=A0A1W2CUV8_9FIRM|nr:amino acid ABC transporter permease [Papillibacter cinnamivorans]SMC89017.1 putative glutamine transport system permease protein [Papillibacter cinnamivorans DSM 12816]